MGIRKFTMKDVRCFAGEQAFNICPITFLVGENSTGKSTALGCLQTLNNLTQKGKLDFNIEPYLMGSFTDIVRKSNPKNNSFQLGIEIKDKEQEGVLKYFLTLIEKDKGSEPVIKDHKILFPSGNEIVIVKGELKNRKFFRVQSIEKKSNKKNKFIVVADKFRWEESPFYFARLILMESLLSNESNESNESKLLRNLIKSELANYERSLFSDTYSIAPIRSKPQRTYDPLKEESSPEGSEMPMVLNNISRTGGKEWNELKKQLVNFGKSSGLFTGIDVRKKLGQSKSDPFQLQIKVRGPKVNLTDVGYGVSQILPILVRIFNAESETTFLMQQPEVHLHPRGQAELSSLFVKAAKNRMHNFVVETHSDYMIGRARIEIMKENIRPENVSLIYLEPNGNKVKVHNITFDKQANMLGAPKGYRDFFLRESNKLLGFE